MLIYATVLSVQHWCTFLTIVPVLSNYSFTLTAFTDKVISTVTLKIFNYHTAVWYRCQQSFVVKKWLLWATLTSYSSQETSCTTCECTSAYKCACVCVCVFFFLFH